MEQDRLESSYYDYMGYNSEHSAEGVSHYLPWFTDGPVLELAPGRGEFLRLLTDKGIGAYGVDLDSGMVQAAQAQGLDVRLGDALEALRATPDGSLGGVFSAHFVEHLHPEAVAELAVESARALRPGGVFVAATPNAGSQSVMGHDFWRDPTHVRFYDERLLAFFCASAGLTVVETGGNPRNHTGPPPEAVPGAVTVDPLASEALSDAVRRAVATRGPGGRRGLKGLRGPAAEADGPWLEVGHLIGLLMERLQHTQQELSELRAAYAGLLDRLFPSNETYVVARRD